NEFVATVPKSPRRCETSSAVMLGTEAPTDRPKTVPPMILRHRVQKRQLVISVNYQLRSSCRIGRGCNRERITKRIRIACIWIRKWPLDEKLDHKMQVLVIRPPTPRDEKICLPTNKGAKSRS